MCVVVISSVSPRNLPDEKPSHECSAYWDGDGRPSTQITRSPGVFSYEMRYAMNWRVSGSVTLSIRIGSSPFGW